MTTNGPLEVVKTGEITIVVFGPEQRQLDELGLDKIGQQLVQVAESAVPPLVLLDMSATEFFGSSYIEILFRTWKKLSPKPNSRFGISGLQPYCREVLEITHLDQLWPLFADRAEGIASFSKPK